MGLSSFFKRSTPPVGLADTTQGDVQQARTRARQRLIGALVLLSLGVIGFPLLFESQPRPIPVDIPITIPSKDNVAPLPMPGPARAAKTASAPTPVPEIITETQADSGREVSAVGAAAAVASAPSLATPVPTAAPAASAAVPTRSATESARAQALLDGKAPVAAASAAGARFIVQVGAFADPAAARETRLKVEKLGLKTYAQVVNSAAGPRTRVRIGPFANRADADKVMARARAAGLAAAVLTL